jgi:hypothetical protein
MLSRHVPASPYNDRIWLREPFPTRHGPAASHASRRPRPRAELDIDVDDLEAPRSPADPTPRVVRNHRRFALSDVTFDGEPVGGATIDEWQDATGAECWLARVLMTPRSQQTAGALAGRTVDGRIVSGRVSLIGEGPAPRPRGPVLMEWHGVSALVAGAVADER